MDRNITIENEVYARIVWAEKAKTIKQHTKKTK